ncbi:PRC-barrel domain containing protein [Streptomyces sp. NPDC048434]|uniref:PRC-barrel domain containing protein n=1 Tax=Streptomyces sp. NPDC048434 TaxID=3365549 RepID=UPI00371B7AE4
MKNIWAYPADIGYQGQEPLTGFTVETPDGTLGQVERQMNEPGRQHLIVDTSVWIFGKSLLVPAGIVHAIDTAARTVTVTHTRDEIKAAPRFAFDSQTTEASYLTEVGTYYATLGQPATL